MTDPDADAPADPVCPVCGRSSLGPACPHLVSSFSFAEGSGEWHADPAPEDLRDAVESLLAALAAGFTERQLQVLVALLSLPAEAMPALAESVRWGDFSGGDWDDYLGQLVAAGRTYAGSVSCESDTPGACSDWTSHYARNPRAWARSAGAALKRTIRELRRAAGRLPPVSG